MHDFSIAAEARLSERAEREAEVVGDMGKPGKEEHGLPGLNSGIRWWPWGSCNTDVGFGMKELREGSMAQADEVVLGFTEMTMEERRAEAAAGAAYHATWLSRNAPRAGMAGLPREWAMHRACRSCGLPSGNWGDSCEERGMTTSLGVEGTMVGTPYCNECERDDVPCTVCEE